MKGATWMLYAHDIWKGSEHLLSNENQHAFSCTNSLLPAPSNKANCLAVCAPYRRMIDPVQQTAQSMVSLHYNAT